MFYRLSLVVKTYSPYEKVLLECGKRLLVNTTNSDTNVRSNVINLYKNLLYLSKEWHTDLRPQIKRAFMKNKDVTDIEEIKKLIAKGEYVCREITATYHLKKYRTMKRRYYCDNDNEKNLEELFKNYSK